jgi:hypothetical protein
MFILVAVDVFTAVVAKSVKMSADDSERTFVSFQQSAWCSFPGNRALRHFISPMTYTSENSVSVKAETVEYIHITVVTSVCYLQDECGNNSVCKV